MQRWKVDFVNYLKQGRSLEQSARLSAGKTVGDVQAEREADPEFAAAWSAALGEDTSSSHAPLRPLTVQSLEALLWSQCPDDIIAAYFSLTLAEMREAINRCPRLSRTYETGRAAGLAALQRAQFESAIDGDKSMLTWLGKQYLQQADKADDRPQPNLVVNFNISDPASSYRDMLAGGVVRLPSDAPSPTTALPAIDLASEVIK